MSTLKYRHRRLRLAYSVKRALSCITMAISSIDILRNKGVDGPKTFSVGEFGWGGTSVKQ